MTDQITGLNGVLIMTSAERFPEMRRFYVEVLGLTPRSDRAERVSFDAAPPAGVRLTIAIHSEVDGASRDPERLMLNFGIDDIEAVAARLRSRGVAFTREPARESFGGRVATFADPDGNTLQLLEPAP